MANPSLLFPDAVVQEALSKKKTWDDTRKYWDNYQWFEQNLEQIKMAHKGKVVIVLDGKIIFDSENMEEVRKILRTLSAPNQSYIRYVPAENELLLL